MESKQTIKLHCMEKRTASGYVTFGSYWEKGALSISNFKNDGMDFFVLQNENKESIPVQSRITAWWPDGSIKWAAHTADASKMGQEVLLTAQIKDSGKNEDRESNLIGATINDNKKDSCSMITRRDDDWLYIDNGVLSLKVPTGKYKADTLAEDIFLNGKLRVKKASPVLYLEEQSNANSTNFDIDGQTKVTRAYKAAITAITVEEDGPLALTIKAEGSYQNQNQNKMKFCIRTYINKNSSDIRFVHTFFFDGNEQTDFLKGLGIRFDTILKGRPYEHHIRFATDLSSDNINSASKDNRASMKHSFHEAAILLNSSYPRLQPDILEKQLRGETWQYPKDSAVEEAAANLPIWNRYFLYQDSADHYRIGKQTKPQCCVLSAAEGRRAHGAMEVCGENGGILLGIRDFWQKYPSGLEVTNLAGDNAACTAWFYSPEAKSFDFRHYDTRSYQMTSYEGFPWFGASPEGIAVTSECTLSVTSSLTKEGELRAFADHIEKPAVYVESPESYHKKRAFGYWSLPERKTESEAFLENQLDQLFDFYKNEIEARKWYGLFDYGDVMHTYDPIRHCWRYDMGGFAWQNTELVPTYWLWLYFLRTGREDVFTVAEAMSRHCSEVDFYHFGPMAGIGSRHNVRHWGCSCKEPRVSMAGHHRVYYYLTGDARIGDAMADAKDADLSMKNITYFQQKDEKGPYVVIRSGPDWTSFLSNWMTQYERTLDPYYLEKIRQGIKDVSEMPFGLASGPSYRYEENGHLIYEGEDEKSPNMHLQICMGGPEVWWELADMLGDETLRKLLSVYGGFYYLTPRQKSEKTNGQIENRPFAFPWFASDIGAYAAAQTSDQELATTVWKNLLNALIKIGDESGFAPQIYAKDDEKKDLFEIPWIKTNFAAQWGLNTITTLEFLRDALPDTMDGMRKLIQDMPGNEFHRA